MSSHREEVDRYEILNKIFRGEVAAVHNYGGFIRIPGQKAQGLVHRSQISSVNVPDATEVLSKGDSVWFKVIGVTDENKISLSMKVVDQGSGKDLDPNGVQAHLDEQQRKQGNFKSEGNAIKLEAVFNTTCGKCGVKGHLSKDCFKTSEGKTYDLIPEPEKETKIFGTEADRLKRLADSGITEIIPSKKKKKEQKLKKKHKRKRDSLSSGSDEAKHTKKKKKRKKSNSSSCSTDEEKNTKRKKKIKKRSDSSESSVDGNHRKRKLKTHKKSKK